VIYEIRHVTTYSYESPVSYARCSLRLQPNSSAGQQLVSHSVDIKPLPAARAMRTDFFGTPTESVLIETPHQDAADRQPVAGLCRAFRAGARR
jgi:transglutaminase-like putative cysteine protease